ncbi:MAG: ATP-binding cassette domain-containing protein [Alphaproteobacteria bacterium]|jgi:peptide/nickel transport system ATP-binding protein/oligopeptide transport system ATP-binding protein|nr:ATP-binding cassette domain-containing protein [Alphaproteobacteria bacterium]
MLEISDLKVHFDVSKRGRGKTSVKAVNGVSLNLAKGDALGLVGESGSGKSTIGKAVIHLVPATAGRIIIDGVDVTSLDRGLEQRLRRTAQMIFQDPHSALNPRMTILRSVAEPLILHTDTRGPALRNRVAELLEIVGLSRQFLYRYPHELSGGQKQRVCIARAIALNPELLILDEPTSALDVSVQAQILEFLKQLQAELDLSYLFISHNLAVVRYLCNRVAVMYLGEIVEEGPAEAVFEDPKHPYTQALLRAVPYPQAQQPDRGEPLSGDIPSPIDLPLGCNFFSRCPEAISGRCDKTAPVLEPVDDFRRVSCHLTAD